MDDKGLFVAALLDASSKSLAAGTVVRAQERFGDEHVEEWGFQRLVDDTRARIENLGESLAVGRPELMRLDVEWLKTTYASRGISPEPVERTLGCLREELVEKLPDDAGEMAASYLDGALEACKAPVQEAPSLLEGDSEETELVRRFLLAVLEGRRTDAERIVIDALESPRNVAELHADVIGVAQAEMGRMWQVGEVHTAEEHLGSRIVEEVLVLLRSRMPRSDANGHTVLVASIPGNQHDIGARIVSDHFEMAGWRSIFLGADTPAEDMLQAVVDFEVDLLALSVGLGLGLRTTARLAAEARARSEGRVPVLVGGRPFTALPDLWKAVGADASAPDAPGAVREGERLVREKLESSSSDS
jgi:methanogenic corrinoid protein MtbC1